MLGQQFHLLPYCVSKVVGILSQNSDVPFLDALASLDFKLSVTELVRDVFTASASTGLSDFFYDFSKGWEDEVYSNQ